MGALRSSACFCSFDCSSLFVCFDWAFVFIFLDGFDKIGLVRLWEVFWAADRGLFRIVSD